MHPDLPDTPIVEQDLWLSLTELGAACDGETAFIELLVEEGVLVPRGLDRDEWRFGGTSLARARTAVRLVRDLGINAPGVALALELLDELAALRARLKGAG
jgi:chaperone modulatory protein CbpM